MTSLSLVAAIAARTDNLRKRHPKEKDLLAELACPPSDPCPPPCRRRGCGRRHRPAERCDDMPTVGLCKTCELTALLPLAESWVDPGDGLRSPSTEGGSRSKGTHADPTASTATAHADLTDTRPFAAGFAPKASDDAVGRWRDERSLAYVQMRLGDAEDALRKALSTVEDE